MYGGGGEVHVCTAGWACKPVSVHAQTCIHVCLHMSCAEGSVCKVVDVHCIVLNLKSCLDQFYI